MIILGVTHPVLWNNGACIIVDGKLIAMVEEERLNRLMLLRCQPSVPSSFVSTGLG